VNYVICSPGQRGAQREKVYFLKTATAAPGQTLRLAKRHALRSTSTSALSPGAYTLAIQVNGRQLNTQASTSLSGERRRRQVT
jgi:hypothetical protein